MAIIIFNAINGWLDKENKIPTLQNSFVHLINNEPIKN